MENCTQAIEHSNQGEYMNVQEIIDRITEERMEHIKRFPGDTYLIEQEIRIAAAQAIEAALKSVSQDLPFVA